MTEYLDMIKNEFGYNTAFVVSESSRKQKGRRKNPGYDFGWNLQRE